MEINVAALRALFEPFDVPHLLRLWAVLAFFIFLWGIFVTISGGYPTAKQFWKVHLIVLGATYVLSGVSFWVFHIDPLLLIMSLSVLAFVVQGDLSVKHQETPLEDWWLFRLHHRRSMESEEEREE
jgi:hypothetical protein